MLRVDRFEFQTDFKELLKPTMRIVTVYVQGMQLNIPPHPRRPPGAMPDNPHRRGQPLLGITVDKILVADSKIVLETNTPGKIPLTFNISNLTLTDVGQKKPFQYDATLTNPRPVGVVHATGHFGPWQKDNPRDTPLDGNYTFSHADMSSIKGIAGTLSSTGVFTGTLGDIAVTGSTDIPNFQLDISDHPVALHTDFQAEVNGMNGDTTLRRVDVRVLHSLLHAYGSVKRVGTPATGVTRPRHRAHRRHGPPRPRPHRRHAAARRQDLAAGPARRHDHPRAPQRAARQSQSVSQKMRLDGSFTISDATFSNPGFQQTIDKLSMRAQGHPEQANPQQAQPVTSTLTGRFTQANAVVDISDLAMTLPGATGELTGRYSLDGQKFDFRGLIRTQATASQMTTGLASKLLRPFDPLLQRNGAGLELPITISGTKSSPKFGIDTKRLFQ